MPANEKRREEPNESRNTIIIIVAIGAAIVVGLFVLLLLRSARSIPSGEPTLQGAIRPGSPEFNQYGLNIKLDEPEAEEAKRALGDIVMSLHTTVRNLTGKTLTGLEIRAAVVDHQGKALKERTVVMIPTRQPELEPNKTMKVQVMLEGMSDTDDRANIKMDVTGFKLKE
jgi:hypothetical protein